LAEAELGSQQPDVLGENVAKGPFVRRGCRQNGVVAGIPIRVTAKIMGWEEDSVERIIGRYVDRSAATRALIAQLDQTQRRT
jgi:hypothetical protein